MAREIINTELGVEQRCTHCREFWPADTEFFYRASGGGLQSSCIACHKALNIRAWHARHKKEAACTA